MTSAIVTNFYSFRDGDKNCQENHRIFKNLPPPPKQTKNNNNNTQFSLNIKEILSPLNSVLVVKLRSAVLLLYRDSRFAWERYKNHCKLVQVWGICWAGRPVPTERKAKDFMWKWPSSNKKKVRRNSILTS